MKGAYILYIELERDEIIRIGALGNVSFKKGFYAYAGSGMGGLEARVMRHLRRGKKLHWHIDYLLEKAKVRVVYIRPSGRREECEIARMFASRFQCVPGFGCSDCRCKSHLFYSGSLEDFKIGTVSAFEAEDVADVRHQMRVGPLGPPHSGIRSCADFESARRACPEGANIPAFRPEYFI
ncbi:MAG: GIY-YIG nuclease family protein [Candidatus Altiarchaeota archaeon]|nr:GIY-YIG nuclease family protein [Candidatus Altiarchaeota archaeon]